jgi:hypothetical protein
MFIVTLLLTVIITYQSASSLTKINLFPPTYQVSDSRYHLVGKFVYIRRPVTVTSVCSCGVIHASTPQMTAEGRERFA